MQKLIIMLFFSLPMLASAQAITQLGEAVISRMKGKSTFNEMALSVEAYFDSIPNGRTNSSYKLWARWANNMSYYTNSRGMLDDVDKKNMDAYKKFKTKSGTRNSAGNWQSLGPSHVNHALGTAIGIGRADRIGFHPTNINIIYIGTSSGGLWKTINGGVTWTPMTDALPTTGISGIVVSHDDPDNKIFILTGDGDSSNNGTPSNSGFKNTSTGVYVSYDGGVNWQNLPLPINDTYFGFNLRQSHTNANVLLAATSSGIYRTNNGGSSWTNVVSDLCYDIEFRPGSGSIVYATTYSTIFDESRFRKSIDGGVTWDIIDDFNINYTLVRNSERIEIAVSPANNDAVYILTGNTHTTLDECSNSVDYFNGYYVSLDNGSSFVRFDNTVVNLNSSCCNGSDYRQQSKYDIALAVNNIAPQIIIAGGIITWRSINFGFNWSPAYVDDNPNGQCSDTGIEGFIHGDIHQLAYQPISNRLWACTDGGVYYSDNNGLYWHHRCSGLVAGQAYHLGVSNLNADVMMIGQQDNGTRAKSTNSTLWNYVGGADGYDVQYKWNSTNSGFYSVNSGVVEFFDNGASTQSLNVNSFFFKRICTPINNNNILYVGSTDITKYEKMNGIWIPVEAYTPSGCHDIERCPSNVNRFYFAGGTNYFSADGKVRRTDDNFNSINDLTTVLTQRVSDVAVRPNNSDVVWYCLGGYTDTLKVFKSSNEGNTWVNMTDNLPNVPCFSLAIADNGDAYLGTQLGVFYRTTTMDEWIPFSNNLPLMPVTDLEISQNKITASTFGRGVWQSDLYSTCIPNESLTIDMTARKYIEVSNSISATNKIYGGASSDIIYKADHSVTLLPGFHVPAYNNFKAYLMPCGVW